MRFWEPVLLILWDAKGQRFYWECIQTAVDESSLPRSSQQKTVSIAIPTANTLNEQGIRRIVARTKKRFNRFAREKEGAEHLLKFLRTTLNLDIVYEPQEGFIQIPQGRFLPKKDGGKICRVFGKMAEVFAVKESKFGLTTDEAVKLSLEQFLCTYEAFRRDGQIEQRDKDGNTVRSWNTFKEYLEDREREQELDEADS